MKSWKLRNGTKFKNIKRAAIEEFEFTWKTTKKRQEIKLKIKKNK